MKQKTAFAIASGLTAFLLVGAGSFVTLIRQQTAPHVDSVAAVAARPAPATTAPVAATAQGSTKPVAILSTKTDDSEALRVEFAKREAEYKALIEQANTALEQANADKLALVERAKKGNVVYIKAAGVRTKLSAKRARAIAQSTTPGVKAVTAELVKYNGSIAFEVALNTGAKVYVNASSGDVLFNTASLVAAPSRSGQHNYKPCSAASARCRAG